MGEIKRITKQTENRFLNMYYLEGKNRVGRKVDYYLASRTPRVENLELSTGVSKPDGVIIYSLYGEKRDRVLLIRQYRYTIDDYIYEFPAGLIDAGEDYRRAAARELKEETGLDFKPIPADPMYEKPYYTSIGMTDESCSMVYGYASGTLSREWMEDNEEIEVVFADREEVRRILREEKTALICAYMLMHFLADEEPFGFLNP